MKHLTLALVLWIFAAPAAAFEGVMQLEMRHGESLAQAEFFVSKAGDVRMDVKAPDPRGTVHNVSTYVKAKSDYYLIAMHETKTVMRVSQQNVDDASPQRKEANVRIEKLGKEKVAGENARHIRIHDKDNGTKTDVWLSNKYPAELFTHSMLSMRRPDQRKDASRELTKQFKKHGVKPGFPLKMRTEANGKVSEMKVIKIKKKSLPKKTFAPPKDYQQLGLPTGGNQTDPAEMKKFLEAIQKARQEKGAH